MRLRFPPLNPRSDSAPPLVSLLNGSALSKEPVAECVLNNLYIWFFFPPSREKQLTCWIKCSMQTSNLFNNLKINYLIRIRLVTSRKSKNRPDLANFKVRSHPSRLSVIEDVVVKVYTSSLWNGCHRYTGLDSQIQHSLHCFPASLGMPAVQYLVYTGCWTFWPLNH